MSSRHRRIATVTVVICGVALIAIVVASRLLPQRRPDVTEVPPVRGSDFRNAEPGVGYVGMKRCQSCHADEHASYAKTAHSQALAKVDVSTEPPDGEFDDPHAGRHYRIYRHQGQLWHEESICTASKESLVLADHPVQYVIGSGRFSRSYLVERDGFLFESPATWYAARPGWNLSPGFDKTNAGLQRPVELRCLTCHAGRVEPVDRSPQKVTFHAQAVDCERCHGPGALHVARRESSDLSLAGLQGRDDTIVNPEHLDRQRREDICAQCHLHSAATIELRGRNMQDFRPGQLLADYAVHFGLEGPKQQMEVVGHVEQMHLSRCYQATETLTCTTCHDPHAQPTTAESQAYYRQKCLACHTSQSCKQPLEMRRKSQPNDNCVACHMPRGPTEIPHFAFTHHRIGIHQTAEPPHDPTEPGKLKLLAADPRLGEDDLARNLGLAYLQLSDSAGQAQHAETYRALTLSILEKPAVQRLHDTQTEAALARLYWGVDPQRTLQHAHIVARSSSASPDDWATACFTLGSTYYSLNQPVEALPWLEKAVKLRPTADIWIMLSDCLEHTQDQKGAVDAARRASELAPDRPRYLQRYVELLRRSGKSEEATKLQPRIDALFEYRKRVDR